MSDGKSNTVACPTCGESDGIDIAPDAELPWERTAEGASARWSVSCRRCETAWTLVDRV